MQHTSNMNAIKAHHGETLNKVGNLVKNATRPTESRKGPTTRSEGLEVITTQLY